MTFGTTLVEQLTLVFNECSRCGLHEEKKENTQTLTTFI
jgi:hypothetical protein